MFLYLECQELSIKKYVSPEIRKRVTEAFKKYNHTPN